MSELRLFRIENGKAEESHASFYKLEREIQNLFEKNLEELLGVRFVATEFSNGQGGRIDTLGIDENGFPVIIEYKLDKNRTVINQGMSYMAWLRSHKMDFWKVVFDKLGQTVADSIDHSSIRLICIAKDFSRDDLGAYELMPNNIDLVRYRRFGETQLLLERITTADTTSSPQAIGSKSSKSAPDRLATEVIAEADPVVKSAFNALRTVLLEQGDDVVENTTKLYFAYKRTRNFASVVPQKNDILLQLHLDPDTVALAPNMKDVRKIGIWGTGQLQIRIHQESEIAAALPLIQQAYEGQS